MHYGYKKNCVDFYPTKSGNFFCKSALLLLRLCGLPGFNGTFCTHILRTLLGTFSSIHFKAFLAPNFAVETGMLLIYNVFSPKTGTPKKYHLCFVYLDFGTLALHC